MRPILVLTLLAGALLALAACSSEGEKDGRVAGVSHRLLLAAGTEGTEALESFPGRLPDGLPVQPPLYPDADILVSSSQPAPLSGLEPDTGPLPRPQLYFIVLDTGDDREAVYAFYERALDQDPWQLESSFSTEQLDTLQFFNVDDIDIAGVVSIAGGGDDGRTSILISLQDAGAFVEEEPPFVLQPSLRVPAMFPPDVPLFEGATITGTAFFREPGLESFLLVFLTRAGQDDVLDFYREEFQNNGWLVQDTSAFGLEGRIDFRDEDTDIQGDVFADRFPRSRRYTEVRIQVQMNPAREPADVAGEPTPDEETPTPEPTEAVGATPTP